MASSYTSAQNQTAGAFGDPTAGFMRIMTLARELSRVIPRAKVNPTVALQAIASKTRIPLSAMFGKMIRSTPTEIRLYVSTGRTTDQAANAKDLYYIKINVRTLDVFYVKKISNPWLALMARRSEVEARQRRDAIRQGRKISYSNVNYGASVGYSRGRSDSIRFRRYRRRVSQMSRSYTVEKIPEQMSIDMVGLEIIPTAESSFEVEAKDFSDTLQTANTSIYSEIAIVETSLISGAAKFAGLGINSDRPSIICSTRPNKDLVTEGTVFDDLLSERFLRLENVYNSLSLIQDYADFDAIKELYDLRISQTKDLFSVLEETNNVELAIKDTIRGDAHEELSAMDFPEEQSPTGAFLQAIYDIGTFPFIGGLPYRRTHTSQSDRFLEKLGLGIKNHESRWYTTSMKAFVPDEAELVPGQMASGNGKRYEFSVSNKVLNILGGHGDTNPDQFGVYGLMGEHYGGSLSTTSNRIWADVYAYSRGGNLNTTIVGNCNRIWTEMVLSKLVTAEHEIAVWAKENQSINFGDYFLDGITPSKPITSIEVPSKMASIAKFVSDGQTYYPFEESIGTLNKNRQGAPVTGRTFYEDILQPALGDIIEGREFDLETVAAWMDETNTQTTEFLDFLNIFIDEGGPLIIFNEVIVAILKLLTTDVPFSHPISAVSNNLYDADNWDILERIRFLRNMTRYINDERETTALVYNTLAWNGSPRDMYMLGYYPWRLQQLSSTVLGQALRTMYYTDGGNNNEIDKRLPPTDDSSPVQCFNTMVSMVNYLFEQIEIGISNSASFLLANKGLIDADTEFDYSTEVSGFFETDALGGSRTACFGIPRFELRMMLWRIILELLGLDETEQDTSDASGLEAQEAFWTQIAALATTNMDPEAGPYRWGISKGTEPVSVAYGDLIDEEFFDDLIPQAIQDEMTEGVGTTTDSAGNEVLAESQITDEWEFLQQVEDYCPFTYILEGEDTGTDVENLVFANRGAWSSLIDDFTEWRTHGMAYKNFLTSVVTPFENLPNLLEGLAANDKIDSIKDASQFPGIEGADVVLFSSKVQDFNRRKDMVINEGSAALNFLPAKYLKTASEYLCARAVVYDSLVDFQRPETAKFQTIGIPCGLIGNLGDPLEPINLKKHATFAFFMDFEFSTVDNMFMPNIYLVPGSLGDCDPESGLSGILKSAKFLLVTETAHNFVSYNDAVEFVNEAISAAGKSADSEIILLNHLVSYCIKECIEIMNGMVIDENTFRYDKKLPHTLVDGDIQGLLPDLLKNPPENIADYFDGARLKTTLELLKENPDLSISEINTIQATLESRIISAATIPASMLGVRMFDRVFHMISHPNQFHVVRKIRTGASELGLSDLVGTEQFLEDDKLKIDMEDEPHGNKLYNDHIGSYSFDLEV